MFFMNKSARRSRMLNLSVIFRIVITLNVCLLVGIGGLLQPSVRTAFAQTVSSPPSALPFQLCWSVRTESILDFASDNELTYLSLPNGKILTLEAADGAKLWEAELGGEIAAPLISVEKMNGLYVVTKSPLNFIGGDALTDGKSAFEFKIRSIGRMSGVTNWQTALNFDSDGTSKDWNNTNNSANSEKTEKTENTENSEIAVFIDGHQIIAGSRSGKIVALDASDGHLLWKKSVSSKIPNSGDFRYQPQIKTISAVSDAEIVLISLETQKIIYREKSTAPVTAVFLFDEDVLIFGDKKGEIRAVNIKTNKTLWKARRGGQISSIVSASQGILISSFDNFVYLFAPNSGKELWKRRLDGRLTVAPLVFDGYVVVETSGGSKADILDSDSGKPINRINLPNDIFSSNTPEFTDRLLIFQTVQGLNAFARSGSICGLL